MQDLGSGPPTANKLFQLKMVGPQIRTAKCKRLNVCHVNVRSLLAPTRLLDLEILSATHDIDILCLSETWLSPSYAKNGSSLLDLPGFQPPVRCDRTQRRGGGVAIYVRRGLPITCMPINSQLEAVCLKIHINQRKFIYVVSLYRPPKGPLSSSDFVHCLQSSLDSLPKSSTTPICLVGDFNAKHSTWWDGQVTDEPGDLLFQFSMTNGFAQVVGEATRIPATSAPAQLDLMFINHVSLVESCTVLPQLSDHCPTLLHLRLASRYERPYKYSRFDFQRADLLGLNEYLRDSDWSSVTSSDSVESALSNWYDLFFSAVHEFVPSCTITVRPRNKPWFSSFLHHLRRLKERLYRRSKLLNKDHRLSVLFRKVRNWYVSELRFAENNYFLDLSRTLSRRELLQSPHHWWKTAKRACGLSTSDVIPTLFANGETSISATERANCLNSAFAAQCSAPAAQTPSVHPKQLSSQSFTFAEIPLLDVFKQLSSLNVWKSPGLDGICHRLLKSCAATVAAPLCFIFNLSLQQGRFPTSWKQAVVQPVHKQGKERSNPVSYRPIALLSSLAKVFERLVHAQLLTHCLTNNIIPDEQFGFLPKRSTSWQLLSIVDDWERALDERKTIHACFLDVAKAFDRVDHGLLLHKLASIGVTGNESLWFESYLLNRSICTAVDGVRSSFKPISSGVPQGSVLGPFLFIIYFRDLPSALSIKSVLFADDTMMYDVSCTAVQSSSPCCSLQKNLSFVSTWANTWSTKFNAGKSSHLLVSRKKNYHPDSLSLDASNIPMKSTVLHLGVTLSGNLSWSSHVLNKIKQVNYKLFLIKRLARRTGSSYMASRLYVGLVRPVIEYASVVWGSSCSKRDSDALERLQLSVARCVLQAQIGFCNSRCMPKNTLLATLNWPTLAWRRRRCQLLTLWLLLHGEGPRTSFSSVKSS